MLALGITSWFQRCQTCAVDVLWLRLLTVPHMSMLAFSGPCTIRNHPSRAKTKRRCFFFFPDAALRVRSLCSGGRREGEERVTCAGQGPRLLSPTSERPSARASLLARTGRSSFEELLLAFPSHHLTVSPLVGATHLHLSPTPSPPVLDCARQSHPRAAPALGIRQHGLACRFQHERNRSRMGSPARLFSQQCAAFSHRVLSAPAR